MRVAFKPSRVCPCGAGLDLPLPAGDTARVIGSRDSLLEVEVHSSAEIDSMEFPPIVAMRDVTCWKCGSVERMTHVITLANGNPYGVCTLADLDRFADKERAHQVALAATLPPLSALAIPEGL